MATMNGYRIHARGGAFLRRDDTGKGVAMDACNKKKQREGKSRGAPALVKRAASHGRRTTNESSSHAKLTRQAGSIMLKNADLHSPWNDERSRNHSETSETEPETIASAESRKLRPGHRPSRSFGSVLSSSSWDDCKGECLYAFPPFPNHRHDVPVDNSINMDYSACHLEADEDSESVGEWGGCILEYPLDEVEISQGLAGYVEGFEPPITHVAPIPEEELPTTHKPIAEGSASNSDSTPCFIFRSRKHRHASGHERCTGELYCV